MVDIVPTKHPFRPIRGNKRGNIWGNILPRTSKSGAKVRKIIDINKKTTKLWQVLYLELTSVSERTG